jgi:phospholipase C
MAVSPATLATFRGVKRIVVLMLENRSFDHLFGFLSKTVPEVAGLSGQEANQPDPNSPASPPVKVSRASTFVMTFDPSHEYYDVQIQLYGPLAGSDPSLPPIANLPREPAPMSGFVASAVQAVDFSGDEALVMGCFEPDQLPVLTKLAREFALFNYWYSSLPGPTWPNRFFIHAATSGGLTDSPSTGQIITGFSFENKTIYERLSDAKKSWRIYHDGLPQTAGLANLRDEFINPLTKNFQQMGAFYDDIKNGDLPDYSFIEPKYDTGNNYLDGNSMHPLNDIRKGEELVKQVYESLRASPRYWTDTMLIITFDEHGGFYDHQAPPATVAPGDEPEYANPNYSFLFQRLGVRVPAIVVSAYTAKATIIGKDPADPSTIFDHSSVLATVEKLFGLEPLTERDAAANTLDTALNQENARDDALMKLPDPAGDTAVQAPANQADVFAAGPKAALSANQKTMAALALACELEMSPKEVHAALIANHQKLVEQKDAADYIKKVADKVVSRRAPN